MLYLAVALLFKAFEHFSGVGHNIGLQRIDGVQLTEKADDLFLGRGIFPQPRPARLPELLHAVPAVHQSDQQVGCRGKSLKAPGGMILEHIPQLPAVMMAVNLQVAPQPRL